MHINDIVDKLTYDYLRLLKVEGFVKVSGKRINLEDLIRLEITKLVKEAYSNGLSNNIMISNYKELKGGETAEYLLDLESKCNIVAKIDNNDSIVEEIKTLLDIHSSKLLPDGLKRYFVKVYSCKLDNKPYIYIMESLKGTHKRFSDIVFKDNSNAKNIMENILNVIFKIYKKSSNSLLKPNLYDIYVNRIIDRLNAAKDIKINDVKVSHIMDNTITVNGEDINCKEELKTIKNSKDKLNVFTPNFTTFVHGDLNLRNIMVDNNGDIKFIDPKGWLYGDYIFDMGKIIHYIEVTGRIEDMDTPKVSIDFKNNKIDYNIKEHPIADELVEIINDKLNGEFSAIDPHYEERLKLSLASNLLGVAGNRFNNNKIDLGILFYCEGMKRLKEFNSYL